MEGKKKELRLYPLGKINVVATLVFFLLYLITLSVKLFGIKGQYTATGSVAWDIVLTVSLVAVGVLLHELFHGGAAMVFGKCARKDVKIGADLKQGLFYCHCSRPITIGAYRMMLITPLIVTGLIPYVICLFFGGLIIPVAFSLLFAGATGDVAMFCGLLKEKDKNLLVLDHSKTTAYYLLHDETWEGTEISEEEEERLIAESKTKGAASLGVKIVLIALFLALVVLALFVVGLIMKFI